MFSKQFTQSRSVLAVVEEKRFRSSDGVLLVVSMLLMLLHGLCLCRVPLRFTEIGFLHSGHVFFVGVCLAGDGESEDESCCDLGLSELNMLEPPSEEVALIACCGRKSNDAKSATVSGRPLFAGFDKLLEASDACRIKLPPFNDGITGAVEVFPTAAILKTDTAAKLSV